MKKTKIIRSLKHRYPELNIRGLKIKVNLNYGGGVPEREGEGSETGPNVDERQRAEMNRVLAEVPDEELKRRLQRLFLKSLEKGSSP